MRALQNFWSRASHLLAPRETAVKRIYVASQDAAEGEELEPEEPLKEELSPTLSPHRSGPTGPSSTWLSSAARAADVKLQVEPTSLSDGDPFQWTDTTALPRGAGSTGERRVSFEATKIQAQMREPRERYEPSRRPEWKDPPSMHLGPGTESSLGGTRAAWGDDLDGLDALRDPTEVLTEQLKRWNKHMTAQESQEPRPWNGNVRMTWTIHMARN
eukprot:s125_g11.t1